MGCRRFIHETTKTTDWRSASLLRSIGSVRRNREPRPLNQRWRLDHAPLYFSSEAGIQRPRPELKESKNAAPSALGSVKGCTAAAEVPPIAARVTTATTAAASAEFTKRAMLFGFHGVGADARRRRGKRAAAERGARVLFAHLPHFWLFASVIPRLPTNQDAAFVTIPCKPSSSLREPVTRSRFARVLRRGIMQTRGNLSPRRLNRGNRRLAVASSATRHNSARNDAYDVTRVTKRRRASTRRAPPSAAAAPDSPRGACVCRASRSRFFPGAYQAMDDIQER